MSDVQKRLLTAAADVFAECGYEGARVADIARRADLTTGAIYSRYAGKAELLAAALNLRMVDEVQELLDRGDGHVDAADIIASLGSGLLEPQKHPEQALLLEAFAAARRDPVVNQILLGRFEDEGRKLGKLLEEGKTDGLVDPALDTESILALCHSVGLGFMMFRTLAWPLPQPDRWNHLIGRLVEAAQPPLQTAIPNVEGEA